MGVERATMTSNEGQVIFAGIIRAKAPNHLIFYTNILPPYTHNTPPLSSLPTPPFLLLSLLIIPYDITIIYMSVSTSVTH